MNIALSKPLFDDDELSEVQKVLASGWVMQGPKVAEFERLFTTVVPAPWAVAVSSCSTALHLAMKVVGVAKGDEVIVPALTWIATAAAVEECGGRPVFCDVDPVTFNIDPAMAEQLITRRTKAIVAVNLFGLAADLPRLLSLAQNNRIDLIEDAACSLGAAVKGRASGTFGRLGCFSFHPRKSITTGEGGMIIGSSPEDENLLRSLRSHGARISAQGVASVSQPFDLGDFDKLGYNYRLTDLQAAIGVAQLRKLELIIGRRREIAKAYESGLAGLEHISLPLEPDGYLHTYQSYVVTVGRLDSVRITDRSAQILRDKIMIELQEAGIATRPGTHAVHALSYFRDKYRLTEFSAPVAFNAMNQSIALPLHPQLTEQEIAYVVGKLRDIHNRIEKKLISYCETLSIS